MKVMDETAARAQVRKLKTYGHKTYIPYAADLPVGSIIYQPWNTPEVTDPRGNVWGRMDGHVVSFQSYPDIVGVSGVTITDVNIIQQMRSNSGLSIIGAGVYAYAATMSNLDYDSSHAYKAFDSNKHAFRFSSDTPSASANANSVPALIIGPDVVNGDGTVTGIRNISQDDYEWYGWYGENLPTRESDIQFGIEMTNTSPETTINGYKVYPSLIGNSGSGKMYGNPLEWELWAMSKSDYIPRVIDTYVGGGSIGNDPAVPIVRKFSAPVNYHAYFIVVYRAEVFDGPPEMRFSVAIGEVELVKDAGALPVREISPGMHTYMKLK